MKRKKYFKIVLIYLSLALTASCADQKFIKDVEKIMGQEIVLPQISEVNWAGNNSLATGFMDVENKMVVWYDSVGCASCRVSKMIEWNEVVAYADSLGEKFRMIYIFTPKKENLSAVNVALRSRRFNYPVFIDSQSLFVKQNPHLPKQEQLHTFLLDKNNKVVLVGNPLHNPKLWELYKSTIQTLLDNNGTLPKTVADLQKAPCRWL